MPLTEVNQVPTEQDLELMRVVDLLLGCICASEVQRVISLQTYLDVKLADFWVLSRSEGNVGAICLGQSCTYSVGRPLKVMTLTYKPLLI